MDSILDIDQLLDGWGFSTLKDVFRENDIDIEALKNLDMEMLKEIIPKIGPRVKFWKKLKEFQCLIDIPIEISNENVTEEASAVSTIREDILSPSLSSASVMSPDTQLSSASVESVASTSEPILIEVNEELPGGLRAVPFSLKATMGLPFIPNPGGLGLYDSTVKRLMDNTEDGRLIVASYKADGCFLRQKLVSLIISNELSNNPKKSISSDRFKILAQEIYDFFPHEDPEVYYLPYVTQNGETRAASGKLYHHYIQVRKQYRNLGLINKKKLKCDEIKEILSNEDDHLIWLKNNTEPFSRVEEFWNVTFSHRHEYMLKKVEISIFNYFKSFPALKCPLGYTLLVKDFDRIYPGHEHTFYNKLSQFTNALVKVSEVTCNSFLRSTIEAYTNKKKLENLDDADQLFVLTIIPIFFATPAPIKSKKKWRPSKLEAKEGFIIHVKNAADIEIALEQRKIKYQAFGLTAQPVPIWVGELSNIVASYVSVNENLYKVETPLKAIDVTFKIYFALGAQYPPEAQLAWLLIQKGIYNINESEKSYISLTTILSDIKKYMLD